MRFNNFLFAGVLLSFAIYSCKVSEAPSTSQESVDSLVVSQDTSQISNELVEVALYRGERTRHFRLIHTKLEVSFDWERQWMFGKALLIVEPYFYEQSHITLDAKGFEVHEVAMVLGDKSSNLKYDYNGEKLIVDLGRPYEVGQKLNLKINYTAKSNDFIPEEIDNTQKGLYFINPHGDQRGKPKHLVWCCSTYVPYVIFL